MFEGVIELCMYVFKDKNPSLAQAVTYSRDFYSLKNVPMETNNDKGGYVYNLIVERIKSLAYPATFLPMFR